MCLPFLKMEDLDDCWDELVDTKPDVPLIDEFINYFNITWMNVERAATLEDLAVANAQFSRDVWNFHDRSHEFRTNNTSETYNHKMNGHLEKSHPNIFRMLELLQEEESRTTVSKDRCDQGSIKVRKTKHMLKDKDIEILKLKYDFGSIEPMEFLMQVEQFIKMTLLFSDKYNLFFYIILTETITSKIYYYLHQNTIYYYLNLK